VTLSANKGGGRSSKLPRWLTPTVWLVLLVGALSLLVLAVVMVVKLHLLSTSSLTGDQAKDVWAFLGVAFGSIVALISTLLIEQHDRRTAALIHEAAEREHLARQKQETEDKEAGERLTTDVVARMLELITFKGGYAPKARVAGAMAMLIERENSGVAMRILKELWDADAVDADTAVWLVDRVLVDGARRPAEAVGAASLLARHATQLLPAASDLDQAWIGWPTSLMQRWPSDLPEAAKSDLVLAATKVFLAREPGYWKAAAKHPLDMLVRVLDDEATASKAAIVLVSLLDRGALAKVDFQLNAVSMTRVRELSASESVAPWLKKAVRTWMETLWVPEPGPA
jgi:hypothetical protein